MPDDELDPYTCVVCVSRMAWYRGHARSFSAPLLPRDAYVRVLLDLNIFDLASSDPADHHGRRSDLADASRLRSL